MRRISVRFGACPVQRAQAGVQAMGLFSVEEALSAFELLARKCVERHATRFCKSQTSAKDCQSQRDSWTLKPTAAIRST